jgi:hypothetical protein
MKTLIALFLMPPATIGYSIIFHGFLSAPYALYMGVIVAGMSLITLATMEDKK